MIQYTDSPNDDESEEDTSIPSSDAGVVAVEGEDGHQYVVLEVIQLDSQDQCENYSSKSITVQQTGNSCKNKKQFFMLIE